MGKKWLDIVYQEKNATKLKKHYKDWAGEYDKDLNEWGYAYPRELKKILLNKIRINKSAKILDAGCGTGYVAETLKDLNFSNIIGLDYSQDMLDVARKKKIYKSLIKQSLNKKTNLRSNQFNLVLCTGVLTSGHVGPVAIKELIRLTKNKSYLILSISEAIYEKLGFKKEIEKRAGEISKIFISKPFIALPNHKSSARSRMYLFQRI